VLPERVHVSRKLNRGVEVVVRLPLFLFEVLHAVFFCVQKKIFIMQQIISIRSPQLLEKKKQMVFYVLSYRRIINSARNASGPKTIDFFA
jgi:hypothetical protein